MKLKVKKLHPDAVIPKYATEGAACFDLHAVGRAKIWPGHHLALNTGLAFEVPQGYALRIASRSGLAFKNGITVFPGVIDSDYRGEVKVLLFVQSSPLGLNDCIEIKPGDRIAQAYLEKIEQVEFEEVAELSETERGVGGFGSTGK